MRNEINFVVLNTREVCGCSRKEVTDGICTEQVLLNLENKNIIPDMEILEAITSRLGIEDEAYDVFLSLMELNENILRYEMIGYAKLNNKDMVINCINKLKGINKKNSVLRKQLYFFCFGILYKNIDLKKSYNYFIKAIKITKALYPYIDYGDELLSKREIEIISEIAILKRDEKRNEEALKILNGIKYHFDKREKYNVYGIDRYACIIQQISSILIEIKDYEQAINVCKEGINVLSEHIKGDYIEEILSNQIKAMKKAKYSKAKIEAMENVKKYLEEMGKEIAI